MSGKDLTSFGGKLVLALESQNTKFKPSTKLRHTQNVPCGVVVERYKLVKHVKRINLLRSMKHEANLVSGSQ